MGGFSWKGPFPPLFFTLQNCWLSNIGVLNLTLPMFFHPIHWAAHTHRLTLTLTERDTYFMVETSLQGSAWQKNYYSMPTSIWMHDLHLLTQTWTHRVMHAQSSFSSQHVWTVMRTLAVRGLASDHSNEDHTNNTAISYLADGRNT